MWLRDNKTSPLRCSLRDATRRRAARAADMRRWDADQCALRHDQRPRSGRDRRSSRRGEDLTAGPGVQGGLVAPAVSAAAVPAPEVTWLADHAGSLETHSVPAH